MGLAAAVLMLMMGVGGASLGDDPDFLHAQELYVDLECEQALVELAKLEKLSDWGREERAQIAMWQALCFAQLAQTDQQERAIARALDLDADVEAPPFTPPKVRESFVAARDQKRAQQAAEARKPKAEPQVASSAAAPALETSDASRPNSSDPSVAETSTANLQQVGGGAMVLGGVALVGGVVSAGFAVPNAMAARDPNAFQQDASEKATLANQQFIAGAIFLGTGVLLLGGGAWLGFAGAE